MTLTPELEKLRREEALYEPSADVKQRMAEKSLVALIGPSAVGKSTVACEVIHQGGDAFSEAYSSVTRPRRADDPAGYQTADEGFTIQRALELIRQREVTNYAIHPSGNIYATLPENFPATYNLLPLLPGSFAAMQKAGLKAVHAVYIVTSVQALERQLADREGDPSFGARLHEGIRSLEWGLANKNQLSFIENIHGQPSVAAARIMALLSEEQPTEEKEQGVELAEVMLEFLRNNPH